MTVRVERSGGFFREVETLQISRLPKTPFDFATLRANGVFQQPVRGKHRCRSATCCAMALEIARQVGLLQNTNGLMDNLG
jgi:hypothetical protein